MSLENLIQESYLSKRKSEERQSLDNAVNVLSFNQLQAFTQINQLGIGVNLVELLEVKTDPRFLIYGSRKDMT